MNIYTYEEVVALLTGMWVDYDRAPYQMATDELDRLNDAPYGFMYQLDKKAAEDLLNSPSNS